MSNHTNLTFHSFNEIPGHMEASEEQPAHHFVVAFCPVFGDDLVVATFPYDESSPDADHYKQQSRLMAEEFARHMNALRKQP